MLKDKHTEFEISKLQKQLDRKKATTVTNVYNSTPPPPIGESPILNKPIATDMTVADGQTLAYNEENGQWEPIPNPTLFRGIKTVDDTYQILVTDYTVVCNKATAFTVTLPTAIVGQIFRIKNINTGIVTVDCSATELIDESETIDLYQWDCLEIVSYDTGKWVIV